MKSLQYTPVTCRFPDEKPDEVVWTAPSGATEKTYPFDDQPVRFAYDDAGFERCVPVGTAVPAVRFTPTEPGEYRWTARKDGTAIASGTVSAAPSDAAGYVTVSARDPRYLATSDGRPFFANGLNLAVLRPVACAAGGEFAVHGRAYIGLRGYERWFRQCAAQGVNFIRIWLGQEYLCPDTDQAGVLDPVQLAKLDALIALARRYGLRMKLTIEQFRYFDYERAADGDSYADACFRLFNKKLWLGDRRCESAAEWLRDPAWRAAWLRKVQQLADRIGGDPTVAVIELWNEMSCLPTDGMIAWNRVMLPAVRAMFPRQLVVNSLGSLCSPRSAQNYRNFCWDASDLVQLHRYLDIGAADEVCRSAPLKLLRDGIARVSRPDRPILVAETGAVNANHTGPFLYYPADHDGLLMCDFVFAPVCCGAAGCGQMWHWESYVEPNNLYWVYGLLRDWIDGVAFDREAFVPEVFRGGGMTLLLLHGKHTALGYLRNDAANWETVLRDLQPVVPANGAIPLALDGALRVFPVGAEPGTVRYESGRLRVDGLRFGVLLRAETGADAE